MAVYWWLPVFQVMSSLKEHHQEMYLVPGFQYNNLPPTYWRKRARMYRQPGRGKLAAAALERE